MTKEELINDLHIHIIELKDALDQSGAVRACIEQDLRADDEAIEDQVSLVYLLIQKSEAMSGLMDDFLESSPSERGLVDKANRLVSEAKAVIARFQENKVLEELGDVTDHTDTIQ